MAGWNKVERGIATPNAFPNEKDPAKDDWSDQHDRRYHMTRTIYSETHLRRIVTRRACAASRYKISKLLSDWCRLMAHVLRVLYTYIIIELPGVVRRNGFIIGPFCRFCHAFPYYMSFDSRWKCLIICFWQLMNMPCHMFLTVDEYALSYVFWQLLKMVHRINRSNLNNQLINLICRKINLHSDYRTSHHFSSFLIFVD